jgi:hypothetical protein
VGLEVGKKAGGRVEAGGGRQRSERRKKEMRQRPERRKKITWQHGQLSQATETHCVGKILPCHPPAYSIMIAIVY